MRKIIRNPRKCGPNPNNSRPNGAAPVAQSLDGRDLLKAALYGNRATRRLALRNIHKRQKAAKSSGRGGNGA